MRMSSILLILLVSHASAGKSFFFRSEGRRDDQFIARLVPEASTGTFIIRSERPRNEQLSGMSVDSAGQVEKMNVQGRNVVASPDMLLSAGSVAELSKYDDSLASQSNRVSSGDKGADEEWLEWGRRRRRWSAPRRRYINIRRRYVAPVLKKVVKKAAPKAVVKKVAQKPKKPARVVKKAPVVKKAAPVVKVAAPVAKKAAPVVKVAAPVVKEAAPVVKVAAPVVSKAGGISKNVKKGIESTINAMNFGKLKTWCGTQAVRARVGELNAKRYNEDRKREAAKARSAEADARASERKAQAALVISRQKTIEANQSRVRAEAAEVAVRKEKAEVELQKTEAVKQKKIAEEQSKIAIAATAEAKKSEKLAKLSELKATDREKEARVAKEEADKLRIVAEKQTHLTQAQRIIAEMNAKEAEKAKDHAQASEATAKEYAASSKKSQALAETNEKEAVYEKGIATEQTKKAKLFSFLFACCAIVIIGFVLWRSWLLSRAARSAMELEQRMAEEKAAADAKKALRDQIDDPALREAMHLLHMKMVGALLSEEKEWAIQIFEDMKERSKAEEAKIAPWITHRRKLMDDEIGDRMATLESIDRPAQPCFQTDIGWYGPDSDEKEYIDYARVKASFAQESYAAVLTGIHEKINSVEEIADLEPLVGKLATYFEFENTLKLAIKDSCLAGGPYLALKLAPVKSMESAGPKLDNLLKQSWTEEKPVGRYITDWNRAMFVSSDPYMLAIAFALLEANPNVEILRVNNKLTDPKLQAEHPDWATNILVNFRFVVPDLQNEGCFVHQVGEVQFILEDFYVVDSVQHKWFEVTRRFTPQEIRDSPIFKR